MFLSRLKLLFQKTYWEMLILIGQVYTSRKELLQIFCNGVITTEGIISIVIILALLALIIQKVRTEIIGQIKLKFDKVQRIVNPGRFPIIGNVPTNKQEYEETKKRVFDIMKKDDVVKAWFNDDELKKFIDRQYHELFDMIGNYPK